MRIKQSNQFGKLSRRSLGAFERKHSRGEREGQIYFWDHELETDPPSYQNMSRVAGNFAEFIERLYEYIEPDESELGGRPSTRG